MCYDADDFCPYEKTPGQIYDEWVNQDREPEWDGVEEDLPDTTEKLTKNK